MLCRLSLGYFLPLYAKIAISAMKDPFYKIVAEALNLASILVYLIRPNLGAPVDPALAVIGTSLYDAALAKMIANDSDPEAREASIAAVAHAVAVLGEDLTLGHNQCLPTFLARMQNEVIR